VDVFEALADPVRRDLLARLVGGPLRVVDLAAEHQISRPAISRHLRVLSDAGLTSAEDLGRERHYRLRREGLAPVRELLASLVSPPIPAEAFDALDLEVRRTVQNHRTAQSSKPDEKEQTG
jgi:DNA-binding transcriptional ArsR family regulator